MVSEASKPSRKTIEKLIFLWTKMVNANNTNNSISIEIGGDPGPPDKVGHEIDIGPFAVGNVAAPLTAPKPDLPGSTNGALRANFEGNENPSATTTTNHANLEAPCTAVAPKGPRKKNQTRSKKHLLAGKELFLADAFASEFQGDPNLILQGCVLQCPNKLLNNGMCRMDWEHDTSLPALVASVMLCQWFTSTKEFRDQLDAATKSGKKKHLAIRNRGHKKKESHQKTPLLHRLWIARHLPGSACLKPGV